MASKRFLFLHDLNVLGWADGQDSFRLHYEFWDQVCSILLAATKLEIGNVLSSEECVIVADLIEGKMDDDSWRVHMALWGDSKGLAARKLIEFLRVGGCVVDESAI